MSKKREEEYLAFAAAKPRMTALSDHPLEPKQGWVDRFNFPFQLGAIYDILRHPETQTPLTVGIYGDWGSGKTSAMKWLEGLLDEWNKVERSQNHVRTLPVWFYPWKYQSREDVWRGIVAEIIIATMNIRSVRPERVLFAVKRFGAFLGKSFVRALSSIKIKAKDPTGVLGEGEITFQAVEKILEDFQDLNNPERAYLNQFESMLGSWVEESLGDHERLVLFVDDLDRCLPDVTLEVLEAIKLYLNIPGLIFVVGLDKDVVESVVLNHYRGQGIEDSKGRDYLAKMFQVDVHLFRMQQAVDEFIDDQLKSFDIYNEEVKDSHKGIFKGFFSRYSGDSPREVKRVINAALIAARGWTTFDMGRDEPVLELGEGLQRHFVRLRLRELGRERVLASGEGNSFLEAWSRILVASGSSDVLGLPDNDDEVNLADLPENYRDLWLDFPAYRRLLGDQLLGDILSVYTYRTSGKLVIQEIRTPIPVRRAATLGRQGARRASVEFDVFLSYNSSDKPAARELAQALVERGLRVWFDEWELPPGQPWAEAIEGAIESVRSSAILVGPGGVGQWQNSEMRAVFEQLRLRGASLIPVLLPGVEKVPELPLYLQQFTWVDLRNGIMGEGLNRLIWGITGTRPEG